jgi:chemotaxis protein methyltransferase CheR
MQKLNISNINDYYHYLIANKVELQEFINSITNLSTYFFRENHHFVYLSKFILPKLFSEQNKIRIWSAGCATGEEAYSVAICVGETFPHYENFNIRILATDINSTALSVAKEGEYCEDDLKMVSENRKKNWFTPVMHHNIKYLQIKNSLKNLIYFNHLNLFEPWPMKGFFDVIFCRNIFIYFSKDNTELLLDRLDKSLVPGGFLIVGHAESAFMYRLKYTRVAESIYEKSKSGNTL